MLRSPNFDLVRVSRVLLLVLADIFCALAASALSVLLRFEFSLSAIEESGFFSSVLYMMPLHLVITIVVMWMFQCYKSLWQYASVREFCRVALACLVIVSLETCTFFLFNLPMFRSYPVLNGFFLVMFLAGVRMSYRLLRFQHHNGTPKQKKRTMLIGAGEAGAVILREFQTSDKSENQVVCIVDDDSRKQRRDLRGVRIAGTRKDIPALVERYKIEEIVFAIPSSSAATRQEFLSICQKTPCQLKTVPGLYQLANGEISIQKIRKLQIEDLLGRDSVHVDSEGIGEFISGKTVLVTGGGGSIGSELCRQLASMGPRQLIIFDIYENNAYTIQQELKRRFPDLPVEVFIGSVRDERRLEYVFSSFRPRLVYHAAAHKHVPLMEHDPLEAVKNNVFGTLNVAKLADKYGADKMVMISTDKAVNPTNIMGTTKRICEMVIEMVGRHSKTDFVSVRFGNVLGSNGSVIPLFQQQIAEGGPVTVTDKRITRFFMTIPEAVSLVLQAGVYATGGEIFILDMGSPVKIDDLARNMIRLSGLEPDVDIQIVYTGLRPGEKLYEELLLNSEGMRKTDNDLIYIVKDRPFDDDVLKAQLDKLQGFIRAGDDTGVRDLLHEIVPEFQEPAAVQ